MSRVAAARVIPYRLRLRRAHEDARGRLEVREGLLLAVRDAEGREAVGDCAPLPPFTQPLDVCRAALESIASILPGSDAREALAERFPQLISLPGPSRAAVETALGFLAAQEQGRPLSDLLAPGRAAARPPRLAVNALVDQADLRAAVDQAIEQAAAGYAVFKVKVGLDAARDTALLRALRSRLGPRAVLRVDANGAWSPGEFLAMAPVLRETAVECVEQPVSPAAPADLLAELRRRSGLRVALDEALAETERGIDLVRRGACDAVVLKPSLMGLLPAARLARAAREAGAAVIVTGAFESNAGYGAALEFAAALGSPAEAHGFATALQVVDDPVAGAPLPEAGYVLLPPRGISPYILHSEREVGV